jgi:hypothetical protein
MHCSSGVEAADQEHEETEADAAVDGAVATAPTISPDESGDGYAEDDQSRDSGGEEGCFGG